MRWRTTSMVALGVCVAVGCGHAPAPPAPRSVLPAFTCAGLCGRAVWPSGEPAIEVDVIITRADGSEDVKVTGDDGVFDFPDAPIGTYSLAVFYGVRRLPDVAVERTAAGPQRLPEIVVPAR